MNTNILALQGGGMLGYGQIQILDALEKKAGPLCNVFKIIGCTSVGSINGAPLALGVPASKVLEFYTQEAHEIFKKGGILQDLEALAHPRYPGSALEEALHRMLGDATLADCKTNLIITSYDFATNRPVYFKSYEKSKTDKDYVVVGCDSGVKLWQACRASAAAQTYFPAYQLGGMVLIDGGNTGDNAPDLLVAIEGLQFAQLSDLRLLSIGTGDSVWQENAEAMINPSPLRAGLETIKVVFSAGEDAQVYKASRLLGHGYYRLSPDLGTGMAIDDASTEALEKLEFAAKMVINQAGSIFNEFTPRAE